MGRSNDSNQKPIIEYILNEIQRYGLNKISILDLGIGYGNFGELIKKNISLNTTMDGVEIWEQYKTEKWKNYYDNIYIEEISVFIKECKNRYDFVLLIDVLEHFDKEKGEAILNLAINLTNKALILSTPTTEYPQGKLHDNPYEEHKYIWRDEKIKNSGFKKISESIVPTNKKHTNFATLGVYVYEK